MLHWTLSSDRKGEKWLIFKSSSHLSNTEAFLEGRVTVKPVTQKNVDFNPGIILLLHLIIFCINVALF